MPVEVLQDSKNKNGKLVEIFTTQPAYDFEGESLFNRDTNLFSTALVSFRTISVTN